MIDAVNMWTCVWLLYAQFAVVVIADHVIWHQCPNDCSCTENSAAFSLAVTCHRHPDIDDGQLSDEIDSMLFNSLTYDHLTWLSIVNTSLTNVPPSICHLTTLTYLNLNNNRLVRLPDNCFTNLLNLVQFTATDNAIGTLQDGVFDGLTKLQYLDLNRNRISSIGSSVFATSSNLSSLFTIILSHNNLTTLEPWVYDRALIGSYDKIVTVNLTYNKISKFVNNRNHLCQKKMPYVQADLRHNHIKHLMDIVNGVQIDSKLLISCYQLVAKYLGSGTYDVILLFDDMPCDCVDYHAFLLYSTFKPIFRGWGIQLNCTLADPVTRKSSIVNGFSTDLSLFVCELTERCPAGCVCVHRPANTTLHVYCSNNNLTVLPLELPELPDSRTKYKVDFSNNQLLRRLEHREYFVNTSILDVSDCSVDEVSDWENIMKITDLINLSGNNITSVPPSMNFASRQVNLANNPWDCSCDNKWMSNFFISILDKLTQKVLCYSPLRLRGRNIIEVGEDEFCVDLARKSASRATTRTLIISVSSVAGVVVVMLSVGVVVVYRLRVKLYTRFKFHPFDRDECLGEDMNYDVFLSCSSDDNLPHGNRIRELLEEHGYRACYPPRDFLAGDTIYDNIYNAVVRSKRTVCLVTENFCQRSVPFSIMCIADLIR